MLCSHCRETLPKEYSKAQPHGDRVIVEDPEHQETLPSGLIFVGGKAVDVVASYVIAVGAGVKDKTIVPGMRAVHTRKAGVPWSGWQAKVGEKNKSYRILKETELLAALSPEAKFEGGSGFYDDDGKHYTEKS